MFSRKKPLPPYGKELLKQKPREIWLFLGPHAWRYAKNHRLSGRNVLILPEDKSPDDYYWPVQNVPVLVFDLHIQSANEMMLKRLAWQLLNSGAEIVHLARIFYEPSFATFSRNKEKYS
jgi:hypothetical protein